MRQTNEARGEVSEACLSSPSFLKIKGPEKPSAGFEVFDTERMNCEYLVAPSPKRNTPTKKRLESCEFEDADGVGEVAVEAEEIGMSDEALQGRLQKREGQLRSGAAAAAAAAALFLASVASSIILSTSSGSFSTEFSRGVLGVEVRERLLERRGPGVGGGRGRGGGRRRQRRREARRERFERE